MVSIVRLMGQKASKSFEDSISLCGMTFSSN